MRFKSIRTKWIASVLLTTLCALLLASVFILVQDVRGYRIGRINDMSTQIELLAYSSAPALQFSDREVANQNLRLLELRPRIREAAIYDANGELFASFLRDGRASTFPVKPLNEGYRIDGRELVIYRDILQNGVFLGSAYMSVDYLVSERVGEFIGILTIVALGALLFAGLVSLWLQKHLTGPILSIAEITNEVVQKQDFSRRAKKYSNDEVGVLVDGFNKMLAEIENRTDDMKRINSELQEEAKKRKIAREEVNLLNKQLQRKVEELKEADRNKDIFLATLAHELRNPLSPIRSGIEALSTGEGVDRQAVYTILERQTNQLVHLVNDLMDISRVSHGKIVLRKETVLLQDIVQDAVETSRKLIEENKHNLEVKLPALPVKMDVDPVRLTQVLQNLLNNAAIYTNRAGNITLEASRQAGEVEITVRDNGLGMTNEMLEKVFTPFVQFENTMNRKQGGLGIGLTLSKELVQLHGGRIQAESAGLGKGTIVKVVIPLSPSSEAEASQASEPKQDIKISRRILIVDDNKDAALTLGTLLRVHGEEVLEVFDGSSALKQGADFKPHIILMDLGMPDLNGIQTGELVRKTSWGKAVIIIAVTGWGQKEDRQKTHEAGFNHHLVKPVKVTELLALLDRTPGNCDH